MHVYHANEPHRVNQTMAGGHEIYVIASHKHLHYLYIYIKLKTVRILSLLPRHLPRHLFTLFITSFVSNFFLFPKNKKNSKRTKKTRRNFKIRKILCDWSLMAFFLKIKMWIGFFFHFSTIKFLILFRHRNVLLELTERKYEMWKEKKTSSFVYPFIIHIDSSSDEKWRFFNFV